MFELSLALIILAINLWLLFFSKRAVVEALGEGMILIVAILVACVLFSRCSRGYYESANETPRTGLGSDQATI